VQQFVDEAFNQKNLTVGDERLSTGVVFQTTSGDDVAGIEGWKLYASIFVTAFPDFSFSDEDTIAEGDKVVLRWSATGTHNGPLRDIAPTGKQVAFTGIAIYRAGRVGGVVPRVSPI